MGVLTFLYYIGYLVHRRLGRRRAASLPARVISVGNLTVGGTGKTSLAISLALHLRNRGTRVAILTRGYKGKLKGPVFVSPSQREEDVGDEPLLMARKLKDIPVIKGFDRLKAGAYALRQLMPPPELFILDDGFQHWGLKRDLDIVVLSATNPFGHDRLLPVGTLREPVRELARADIIVVTKCREVPEQIIKRIREHNRRAPVYPAWYEPSYVIERPGGNIYPPRVLEGRKVYAFTGIGEPDSFRQTLVEAGAVICGFRVFPDHYRFKTADLKDIAKRAAKCTGIPAGAGHPDENGPVWIITTEKDIMRLERRRPQAFPFGTGHPVGYYALAVDLRTVEGFYAEAAPGARREEAAI